jgi:spermidine synthase
VLTYFVPSVFSRLLWGGIAVARGNFAVPCTVAQFVVSGLLIALPTISLGATFPVAVRICTPNVASIGRGTARVYAANTAGAMVGALLAGLVLIPAYGTRVSLLITAALFAAAGIFLIWRKEGGWKTVNDRRVQIGATVMAALAIVAMILPHQIVLNFLPPIYGSAQTIYHGEGIAHTVDILRTKQNVTVMSIAGNMEADSSYVQRRHFILKADLPLLLQRDPRDVAVIGLGLGITLSAIARYPGIQHVQVIELSPEMVKAQAHVEGLTGGVLQNSKVRVRIDDGRNFLAMSNASFDMITADPIHPRNSGVGYLYTREYYEAMKRRLRPDGIVCQWMPMYEISKKSFDVAFRTFVSVFPHASFWYVRGHGLFVATLGRFAIDYPTLAERLEDPVVKRDLASINIFGPTDFLSYMLMGPPEISAYMAANPSQLLNTDDNAYLEYHTPFEFLLSNRIEVAAIVAGLLPYAGLDIEAIQGLPPGDQQRLMEAWGRRRDRIVPEVISPPEVR